MPPWSRRELLAALLGTPFAWSVGCRDVEVPLPPGELIGPDVELGHRLRERRRPEFVGEPERVGVVIVGGGAAGLSAAWRLQRAGFEDFVLLELERVAGGTARSGADGVVPYPWGAHYLPVPDPEHRPLVALLDEMGVVERIDADGRPQVAEQFLVRDPEERIFFRGRWYEGLYLQAGASPADLAELARFQGEVGRWAAWRDARGRPAFAIPLSRCSDDAEATELDRITMAEWLAARGFASPRLLWFVDYACRDDYGLTVGQTSAWAGLFYFASRYQAETAESQPLISWPEGNGRIIAHLHAAVREQVQLGWAAYDVAPVAGEHPQVRVLAVDRAGRTRAWLAERVIFAAPQFVAQHVLAPWREAPPAHVEEFQYGSWMVANLFLDPRPEEVGFAPAWDNVLYESPSLGYVSATHQRGLDRGPTVWTYYYPLCDDDPSAARRRLLELDRDHWAEVALADLARAHPNVRACTRRLDVMRWGHAMIRPRPGFVWTPARRSAATPFAGIHFAHTDLSGVALFEEAFDHGLRAADEVLAELKVG